MSHFWNGVSVGVGKGQRNFGLKVSDREPMFTWFKSYLKQRKAAWVAKAKANEFSDYVLLGDDGLGYIAVVNTSKEEAIRLTKELSFIDDADWDKFVQSSVS